MSRRADPVRIYLARLAGFERQLMEEFRLPEERAQALITAWEAEASRRGLLPLDDRLVRRGAVDPGVRRALTVQGWADRGSTRIERGQPLVGHEGPIA